MRRAVLLGVIQSALCACGPVAPSGPPIQRVNVDIVGITVGPSKVDGTFWDGTGNVPTTIKTKLIEALAKVDPYLAVGAILTDAVLVGTQAPDPYGGAELALDGTYDPTLAYSFFQDVNSNQEDTYTSIISHPGWSSVPIVTGTRIRVTVFDEDLINDDPVGVAEINSKDLQAALDAQKVFHVNVANQTSNQLLFVDLSVRAAP